MILWSGLYMNLDVQRNSTLQYFCWHIVQCTSVCCSSQNCTNRKNIEKLWVNLLPGHRNLTRQGPRIEWNTNAFNMQCNMRSQQAVTVLTGCSWPALSLIPVVYVVVILCARMVGERKSSGLKSWPFFGHLHLSRMIILIVAPAGAASIPCWLAPMVSQYFQTVHVFCVSAWLSSWKWFVRAATISRLSTSCAAFRKNGSFLVSPFQARISPFPLAA